jgi:hypothetical protein
VLPDSQEISEPASDTSPFCLRSKIVWIARTKSCGALPPVAAIRSSLRRARTLASKSSASASAPSDQAVLDLADPAVEDVAEGPARARGRAELGHHLAVDIVEAVKAEVVVRDDDEEVAKPFAWASSTARRAMKVLPQP